MGDAARREPDFDTTEKPSTVRMRSTTLVMRSRPAPPPPPPVKSPAARSVEIPQVPPDVVIFPGEKLASVDDFVRLRMQARSVTFLGVLMREGISYEYYTMMCDRFAAARRADPELEKRFRVRIELAQHAKR